MIRYNRRVGIIFSLKATVSRYIVYTCDPHDRRTYSKILNSLFLPLLPIIPVKSRRRTYLDQIAGESTILDMAKLSSFPYYTFMSFPRNSKARVNIERISDNADNSIISIDLALFFRPNTAMTLYTHKIPSLEKTNRIFVGSRSEENGRGRWRRTFLYNDGIAGACEVLFYVYITR